MNDRIKLTEKSVRVRLALLALAQEFGVRIGKDDGTVRFARNPKKYPYVAFDWGKNAVGFGFLDGPDDRLEVSIGKFIETMKRHTTNSVKLNDELEAEMQSNGDVVVGCQIIKQSNIAKFITTWIKLNPKFNNVVKSK